MSARAVMTKTLEADVQAWLERVYAEADRLGDRLDPNRKRASYLVAKIDSIGRIAHQTIYYMKAGGR